MLFFFRMRESLDSDPDVTNFWLGFTIYGRKSRKLDRVCWDQGSREKEFSSDEQWMSFR
jgi:hypothetical protein